MRHFLLVDGEVFRPGPVTSAGRRYGWQGSIEVWPEHKDVVIPDAGEHLLTTLNDRRITRVLIPSHVPRAGTVLRESLDRLRRTVVTAYGYGSVDGSVEVRGDATAEQLIEQSLGNSTMLSNDERERALALVKGSPDRLTPIPLDELAGRLIGLTSHDDLGMSEDYLSAHGEPEEILARHKVAIG